MAIITVTFDTLYETESGVTQQSLTVNNGVYATSGSALRLQVNRGDTIRFRWGSHFGFPTSTSGRPTRLNVFGLDNAVFNASDADYVALQPTYGELHLTLPGQSKDINIRSDAAITSDFVRVDAIGVSGYTSSFMLFEVLNPTDDTPDAFDLGPNISGALPGSTVNARPVTVTGINVPVTVRRISGTSNFAARVNNGGWVSLSSSTLTANQGDRVYLRCIASSTVGQTFSINFGIGNTSDSWAVTTGSADSEAFIPLGINSGLIKLSDLRNFFGHANNPARLTDYRRGGSLVPNITQNSNVPSSGTIALTDFYGSGLAFGFNDAQLITSQSDDYNTLAGASTRTLTWSLNNGFALGPSDGLDDVAQFSYTWAINTQFGNSPTLLSQSGSPSTFSNSNRWVSVRLSVGANSEHFCTGTITIRARFGATGPTVTRKVNFFFNAYGN